MASIQDFPKTIGLLIFPGFEALDAFGPMEVINDLSRTNDLTLCLIAQTLDPVSTQFPGVHSVGQRILPTHTFTTAPTLDVLIIPGGFGAFKPDAELLAYVTTKGKESKHVITVCNGAALLAQTGFLDGKRATTNKAYWKECCAQGPRVNWVAKARWVRDGDVWTSSGVSAGIDCVLAWVESLWGKGVADGCANGMEFVRAEREVDDPFAGMYGCVDAVAEV